MAKTTKTTKKTNQRKAATALDQEQLLANLPKLAPHLRAMPRDERPTIATLKSLVRGLPPTLEATLAKRARKVSAHDLALVMLVAETLGKGAPTSHGKSVYLRDARVFPGDLHVKGDLAFGSDIYVLGDVIVDGTIEERPHTGNLIVAGSIRAHGIKCGARIYSGKTIRTEVLFVEVAGRPGAIGGINADLAIIEDADDIRGVKLAAKQRVVLRFESTVPLEKLKSILAPNAFGLVDGEAEITDDSVFDYTNLMATLSRKKPWDARKAPKSAAKPKPAAAAKKPAKPKLGMFQFTRYFELRNGSSSKFWEIQLDGAAFTTRYGRIGHAGQTSKKKFRAPAEASYAADQLIKAKKQTGYKEKP
ncbi:MAG: WGR domain-containing protein [Kofleriaceae bacterium]